MASVSKQASELAIQVLKDGGNAFDAAFSLAFSLCVYHPQAGNIGGGGYAVFKEKNGSPKVFNYREQASAKAKLEDFLLPDGKPNPDKTSFGPTSICIPGSVKAFFTLHRRYGKLNSKDILKKIARLAKDGVPVTEYEATCLNRLAPKLAQSPEARRFYVKDTPFKGGDILKNENLAKTLECLAEQGEKAFYEGSVAEKIVRDMEDNDGFISAEDLANYEIKELDPVSQELNGYTVYTTPPESGGGILMDILNIRGTAKPDHRSPEYYHQIFQAWKMAFIRRMEYMGDVSLEGNTVYNSIFSKKAGQKLYNSMDMSKDMSTEDMEEKIGAVLSAEPFGGGSNTTHFSIIDADGNTISNTYTLNLRFGSKWAIKDAGFLINGSADSFSFVEGEVNYFGVRGCKPNLFAPGKRPASNMSPVMVMKGNEVAMTLGTPGGPTIPSSLSEILISSLLYGKSPVELIECSRLHHQAWPDILAHEPDFDRPDLLETFKQMGYTLKNKNETISDMHCIFKTGEEYTAVCDFRREGLALGI